MFSWLQGLLLLSQTGFALVVGYLLLLTLAAWRAPRKTIQRINDPHHRFIILIPAHNEEKLLPELLENLAKLNYPAVLYSVHVIADNCVDQTAQIARQMGAVVHQRTDLERRGKGYALQWALDQLEQAGGFDAVIILDADSIISNNFLSVADAHLSSGEKVVQAYYTVRSPLASWTESIRFIALAVLHYLRPQGRTMLGGSVGLKGNGMIFAADTLNKFAWSASVTEDIELHMKLVMAEERVTFAPDAIVWGQMPDSLSKSKSQHDRWESGRLEMARRFIPALAKQAVGALKEGSLGRSFLYFDALMEHIIPPFSILVLLSGVNLFAALCLLGIGTLVPFFEVSQISYRLGFINVFLSLSLSGGIAFYIFSGLRMVNAPKGIYRAFLHAPYFIFWKLWQYMGIFFSRGREEWVRTTRNEG